MKYLYIYIVLIYTVAKKFVFFVSIVPFKDSIHLIIIINIFIITKDTEPNIHFK